MDRPLARRLLLVALPIGVLADVLLDGPALGVNVVVLVAALLAAGWWFRRPGRAPDLADAWLPLAALVLAGWVAVRADPFLALVDAAGAAVLTGASLAAFSGLAVTRRSASIVMAMGAWVVGAAAAGAVPLLRRARRPGDAAPRCLPA